VDEMGRRIAKEVRAALESVLAAGPTRVAAAANVGRSGHTAAVYSDDHVSVVTSDGEVTVVHHGERDD